MPRQSPSLQRGLARQAHQSEAPDQWVGLRGAWHPALGMQGSRLYDVSGYAQHGTMTSTTAPVWTIDAQGHGLLFDATDDYVDPGASLMLTAGQPFSISWWEKQTAVVGSTNYDRVGFSMNGSSNKFIAFRNDHVSTGGYARLSFGRAPNTTQSMRADTMPTLTSKIGLWTHIVITGNDPNSVVSTDYAAYMDGVSYPIPAVPTVSYGSVTPVNRIGFFSNAGAHAMLADIRVYTRRIDAQVSTIFADPEALYRLARPETYSLVFEAGAVLVAQERSLMRRVGGRIFGRVN